MSRVGPGTNAVVMQFVIVAVMLVAALASVTSCAKEPEAADTSPKRVFVLAKIVPFGMLVGVASENGSIKPKEVPADVVPADALTTLDGLRCEVAAIDLPAGTILRRSHFTEPAKVGLAEGLTNDTSKPTGC